MSQYILNILIDKLKRKSRARLLFFFKSKSYYIKLYKSYWYYRWSRNNFSTRSSNYYSAIPNPGAGIGHQMANWIAGYWFARQFGLQFAHIPFSSTKSEYFLGFGHNEITVEDLLNKGYTKVRLPLFNELNKNEVDLQKKIISSYSNKKIVFVAEQDQFHRDHFGVMDTIKEKFYQAPARISDELIFDTSFFNIAIHVRRGDIVGQGNQNPNLRLRWQDNDYFKKVLQQVVQTIKTEKPIAIYLFSQGKEEEFTEFQQFNNLHYCLSMNAQDSFLHMVYADLLITSKSSFSYKPALLSNGIKICPQDFWHGYPRSKDWILVNNDGTLNLDINEKIPNLCS